MRKLLPLFLLVTINAAKADPPVNNPLSATTLFPSALSWITSGIGMDRGVAYQEQLKDDIVAFENDWQAGLVRELAEIRQDSLKETLDEMVAHGAQGDVYDLVQQLSSKLQE